MTAPYAPGDVAAVIELQDEKVIVTESTVLRIEPDAVEGRWRVYTDHGGWTTTDAEGVGTYVVPIDEELAQDFVNRGPRFEVEPMARHELYERELNRDGMYRDFELGRDGDGYGYNT